MAVLAKRLPLRVDKASRYDPDLHSIVDSVIEFFADRASPSQSRRDIHAARTVIANAAAQIGHRRQIRANRTSTGKTAGRQ
jgi:hypothetical protein